VEQPHL